MNAGATEQIIMLARELVSEAKSGNEKCWKLLQIVLTESISEEAVNTNVIHIYCYLYFCKIMMHKE